jgi:proteic killer suppression protein
MAVPSGNRLEALKGGRKGQHSVRVNDRWRICFRWHEGNAYEVEMVFERFDVSGELVA